MELIGVDHQLSKGDEKVLEQSFEEFFDSFAPKFNELSEQSHKRFVDAVAQLKTELSGKEAVEFLGALVVESHKLLYQDSAAMASNIVKSYHEWLTTHYNLFPKI
jgi:hypothetical protein